MKRHNTYIRPQVKLYSVNTTIILAGSTTKSMSVGGDETDVQLSKGMFSSDFSE